MRLLVIEDDATIASFVVKGLQEAGFAVDHADDGRKGLALARTEPYDLAVVDVMLPGLDGLSLIEELRRGKVRTPVLILSAKRSVDDRVRGLQAGGDDYLVKPFAFAELLARVQALIRRSTGETQPTRLVVGDLDARPRQPPGRACEAPRSNCGRASSRCSSYLMRNAGRVVSKTMILEHVWNYSFDPRTNVVDVLVFRLREKIDRGFEPKMVQTVRGIGYVLK